MDGHPAPFRMFGNRIKAVSDPPVASAASAVVSRVVTRLFFVPAPVTAASRAQQLMIKTSAPNNPFWWARRIYP